MSHNKVSGNGLSRISVLGADGGSGASSLSLRERMLFSFSGLQDQCNRYTTNTLHFRRLFSVMLVTDISTRIKKK